MLSNNFLLEGDLFCCDDDDGGGSGDGGDMFKFCFCSFKIYHFFCQVSLIKCISFTFFMNYLMASTHTDVVDL